VSTESWNTIIDHVELSDTSRGAGTRGAQEPSPSRGSLYVLEIQNSTASGGALLTVDSTGFGTLAKMSARMFGRMNIVE